MSMSEKSERALLGSDEIAVLRSTHHPEIYELSRKELSELQSLLRDMRAKARTLTRQKERELRGKSDSRGKSFPGNVEQPRRRKQIFAAALKRVKKELQRLQNLEARTHHIEAAQRALAQRRASNFISTAPKSQTPGMGMEPLINRRRRRVLPRGKVGSVLKQNKVAQAARDARPS